MADKPSEDPGNARKQAFIEAVVRTYNVSRTQVEAYMLRRGMQGYNWAAYTDPCIAQLVETAAEVFG